MDKLHFGQHVDCFKYKALPQCQQNLLLGLFLPPHFGHIITCLTGFSGSLKALDVNNAVLRPMEKPKPAEKALLKTNLANSSTTEIL
ncbi:MAG: hypothetical protein QXD34_06340 [Candidatus Bathyarchaeia archaeon]